MSIEWSYWRWRGYQYWTSKMELASHMQGKQDGLALRVMMCEVSRVGSAGYECLKHQSNRVAWSVSWDEDRSKTAVRLHLPRKDDGNS